MIRRRFPFYRQPQGNARYSIDWGNPLTNKLCFLAVFSNTGATNLVTNEKATFDTSTVRSIGGAGRAIYASSNPKAAAWPGTIATDDGTGNGAFSFLTVSAPISEANISALISQCAGNALPQGYVLANTSSAYAASAGNITFGGTSGLMTGTTGYIDGRPHTYVCTRATANGEHVINVDGVDVATQSINSGDIYTAGSSEIYASGIKGYTTWTRAHPHFLQAAWNRYLTKTERQLLGANPWQLCVRMLSVPVFVPVAAAGGFKAAWAKNSNRIIGVGVGHA